MAWVKFAMASLNHPCGCKHHPNRYMPWHCQIVVLLLGAKVIDSVVEITFFAISNTTGIVSISKFRVEFYRFGKVINGVVKIAFYAAGNSTLVI